MESRFAVITFFNPGERPDNSLPSAPVYPSQGLPGGWPVDPGFGVRPPVDPGYGRPGGGRPDNSLPSIPPPGHIATLPVFPWDPTVDNSLPTPPARPDQGLPGAQPGPDQGLPGSQPGPDNTLPGQGARPDNSLPGQIRPGAKFVVKWLCGVGLILVPDQSLPPTAQPK
jgi:hypothetical protein